MNFKRLSVGTLIILLVGTTLAFIKPDDELVTKIVAQLDKWRAEYPQEKVYLHFDKPSYAIGEDIWFKAYVTIGSEHKLSAYSETLNVDLIDDNDSVKRSLKLPLTAGLAAGDFALADSMSEGNYRIRAYTNWMRNQGEAYFFDKTIAVVNGISNKVFTKTAYNYSTLNGKQKVTAVITYTDLNGIPYVNKPVSYEAEINGKSIAKGKGVTDDKGNLTASFTNNSPVAITTGHINTEVKLDDKRTVTKAVPIKTLSNKVDVQFFPESGNLINGIFEKVAFKAVGADGLGVDIKGYIADDQNNQISALGESHFGMGTANFEPESGKTYKAHITYADGSEGIFDLPKAVDNGYVLSVNSMRDDKVFVSIIPGKNAANGTASLSGLTLIAQSGGELCYAGKSKDGATSFSAAIPKDKFPSGIVQFTLFSATGEPLNERLVFIQNPDQLKLAVTSEKQSYKPREKVTINLNAKISQDKPVIGSFSASVIDESKVNTDEANESSIFSTLLLTSDLRGYIEKPNYYFTNVSNETKANLDALMLTQGYHRFEWKQLLAGKFTPIVFKPEKSLEVTGHLKTFGGKPVPNGKVTLFSTAGGTFIIDTVADAEGKFTFKDLVFRDSIKFVIQARTAKDRKNLDITLDKITPQAVGPNKNAPDIQININDGASAYLLNSKKLYDEQVKYGIGNHTIVLKEVVIKEKRENPFKNSANLNGAGNADQTLTSKDLIYGGMLSQVLQGRLNFVTFRNGIPYSTRSPNTPMQIILDGAYVESDFLDNLTPSDVATVEVLRTIGTTAIYGARGSGGVLVITTKRGGGDAVYNKYAPGIATYAPKGYYRAREFYSPKYDDPKTNAQMQDLRSTIYWSPGLITDKDGNTSMSFFNADAKGTYRVIIEGIDADGNLGRQVYRYKVE
ncbi:TonB-dependent receptor plug domain-containing protein [Mucilaginibacter rubeus]|uniref:TonB-dependent receptor plug domain-containing protein n=1 Tax=Mucilaginibacter rubeus TaxID=2027860 RepID=A0A5C1I375_9SPHI|nr:TonB-dependent receptor plug domain-containing protein [Mucilaginibacter rubeus]QEM12652.1 TonB-dependent receptor plug domain-containing protein [Mucilaginibacter rubeus]